MVAHLVADAGQSSTRYRYVSDAGAAEAKGPGVVTDMPLLRQLGAGIEAVLDAHPDWHPHTVALGSSGNEDGDAGVLLRRLAGRGVAKVILCHDSVTSYLGALGSDTGCVIAAGTGTICFAVGPESVARVDGWGYLMGDAGSAYWIGRTGLEAALRGFDGRRQMTALTEAMAEEYPNLERAYLDLQTDVNRVQRVASFAAKVDALAASDRVAGNILDKAAAHLSEAVQAAIRRVELQGTPAPRVAAIGGVFDSHRVVNRFTDYLSLQWPNFALTEPQGQGIDGAQRLVDLPDDHPLHAKLSVAHA
ncbi:N-acetylglucosamine kinase [Propioniciclava soli]|uniref:BadF/BadG/BcrA/BcrD ATPase family protein n=1 Tax=Propioniciclava soli TaxID=2775081 RepID=A0ABZ3C5V1_9ACTN|nr:BadF/BadG/BcrA/BcrD ATPase family protein [Propioniciclava soli]